VRKAIISIATLGLALITASPAVAATSGPPTPIDLFNGYQACSTDVKAPVYLDTFDGLNLEALSQDTTDSPFAPEHFQVYPVSDPAQVLTFSNQYALPGIEEPVSVPGSDLTDGQTYAWQVQTVAASGTSAWSAPCYVTIDNTSPSAAPTVTSSNYPQGQRDQGGAPIQVTLGANGVSDVAGYVFSWDGVLPVPVTEIGPHGIPQPTDPWTTSNPITGASGFVQASSVGGSATVGLVPPQNSGFLILTVASLDRAYNESPTTTYYIFTKPDAPTITWLNPNIKFAGNGEFHINANPALEAASPVVSYTVQFYGGAGSKTFTAKASADGSAEFGVPLDGSVADFMVVTSTSADGWVSENSFWNYAIDTSPTVSSDVYLENQTSGGVGVPGTFTFAPKVKGITSYTYSFSDGTSGTVAAKNGTAQVTWTPQQSGFYFLDVYGTTKDGIQLSDYFYVFFVN
jgi:hypothetical protein